MTDLSPAAQAVLDAWESKLEPMVTCLTHDPEREALATALETAVDQVVPKKWPTIEDYNEYEQGVAAAHIKCRNQLLAIANELRGDTTSNAH